MSEQVVRIRGIDPLLFRDGRPFAADIGAQSARTLIVPYPATIAGFLRTMLGNQLGAQWEEPDFVKRILNTEVHAPLLMCNEMVVLRAPADALVYRTEENQTKVAPLRPYEAPNGAGCDLPAGLQPLRVPEEVKPAAGFQFWKWDSVAQWLQQSAPQGFLPEQVVPPEVEERIHVTIDEDKGSSAESYLFSAQFVVPERYRWRGGKAKEQWAYLARVTTGETVSLQGIGTLGGEKRLAAVEPVEPTQWQSCPSSLAQALASSKRVRMALATPAIFAEGWKPGWLDKQLEGSPPSASSLKLKLVSAAVRRREAVSGWSYRKDHYGPKPTRLLAPAGSVYFFEVLEGDASVLSSQAWLAPVSDDPQDRRDGYGLAIWGIWSREDNHER